MEKPVICVDFDGVLNDYNGYDPNDLGSPKAGCKEFLKELCKNYCVVILSARRYSKIIVWLDKYDLLKYVSNVTSYKPPAFAYIDDRSVQFTGDYNQTLNELKEFKPYWK